VALVPNLPPGTGNVVNPAVTPTWAFTPNTRAASTVRIVNTGRNTVYVGLSQMTQNNALPVPPGGKPLDLAGVTQSLYALSGVGNLAVAATMSSSAVTVGTTAITLTAAVPAGLAAGTTVVVGSTAGTGWEAQVVASTTASSQITFANALVQDHAGSGVIYTATALPAQVKFIAGVL
jgi:hypothetical protein